MRYGRFEPTQRPAPQERTIDSALSIALIFLLALLGFALVGFVVTLKAIFGKKKPPQVSSRRQKLEVVEELLGDDMPEALADELAQARGQSSPQLVGADPSCLGATDEASPEPPSEPRPDLRVEDDVELADAGLGSALPIPGGRLPVDPELADMAKAKGPGLVALLSFENVIFVLSALLILGGTLYFAAVTWNEVPGAWQYFFVELVILIYGSFMLAGSWLVRRRLQLDKASLVLDGTAAAVALIAAAIAAAAFFQSLTSGFVGTALVAFFAWIALRRALHDLALDLGAAPYFAACAALIGLSGAAAAQGSSALAGALALAATILCLASLIGSASRPWLLYLLCLATTVTALLLSMPGHVELAHVAPTLVALSWCAVGLRRQRRPWMTLIALGVIALGLGLSSSSAGALAIAALMGSLMLLFASSPLPDDRGRLRVDGFSLIAIIAGAALWVLLSIIWAPAIGLLLPASAIEWLVELVTRPGQQVSASWDGLAALPSLVLALVLAERLRLRDDRRHLIVELAGLGTLILSLGLTALTFARQPLASGVIVLLLAGTWAFWSARRASAWRMAVAELALLLGVASLGYAHGETTAWISSSVVAVALAALPSRSGRWVATLSLPILSLGLIADARAPAWLVVGLLSALGGLQLWQRGARAQAWLRPFAPPTFVLAWIDLLYYRASGASGSPVDDDLLAPSLVVTLVLASAWVFRHRGPRFLRVEVRVLASLIALFSTLYALEIEPGQPNTWLNGGAAIAALLCLLPVTRGARDGTRRLSWALALLLLPIPAAALLDAPLAWPAAGVASLALAVLLWRSRRERSPWMASLGFALLWITASWWTLVLARHFSTGGGEERVLTALATVCVLVGGFIARWGQRVSAATTSGVRGFAFFTLALSLSLGLAGMTLVARPGALDQGLAIANLLAIGAFAWMLALRHRRGWLIYLAEASVVGMYAYLRGRSDLLDGLRSYDGVVLAAGALGFVALSQLLQRRKAALGVDQSRRFAAALPLLVPFVLEWDGQLSESTGLALASAVYGWLARRQAAQRYAWLAAAGVNLMLLPLWIRFDVHSPIAYAGPLGLTLMFMARVYQKQLEAAGPAMRTAAALLLLGSSSLESFAFTSVWPALLLAGLSIGAVLLGLAWRQRAYLYAGFIFLLMDMVVNLSRWGMQSRLLAGTLGVIAGVALFALGVVVAKRKQELLAHYQRVQRWQW